MIECCERMEGQIQEEVIKRQVKGLAATSLVASAYKARIFITCENQRVCRQGMVAGMKKAAHIVNSCICTCLLAYFNCIILHGAKKCCVRHCK